MAQSPVLRVPADELIDRKTLIDLRQRSSLMGVSLVFPCLGHYRQRHGAVLFLSKPADFCAGRNDYRRAPVGFGYFECMMRRITR